MTKRLIWLPPKDQCGLWLSPNLSTNEKQAALEKFNKELALVQERVYTVLNTPYPNPAIRTEVIRRLNDLLRIYHFGGHVLFTQGVACIGAAGKVTLLESLAQFNDFNEDNDPYDEHDCAIFAVEDNVTYMFKIDYYDDSLEAGCENPADPTVTTRVITIMTPSEY